MRASTYCPTVNKHSALTGINLYKFTLSDNQIYNADRHLDSEQGEGGAVAVVVFCQITKV